MKFTFSKLKYFNRKMSRARVSQRKYISGKCNFSFYKPISKDLA